MLVKVALVGIHILAVGDKHDERLNAYLLQVQEEVKNTPKLKTLKHAIEKNPTWFKLEIKQTGNIIFNYYHSAVQLFYICLETELNGL